MTLTTSPASQASSSPLPLFPAPSSRPTNIFSLTCPLLANIFWYVGKESEAPFSLTCRYFNLTQTGADKAKKIHEFILHNFDLVKRSSFVKEFTLWDMFRMRGLLLGEGHLSDRDRQVNSQLVDLTANQRCDLEVFLEAEDDDTQISGASEAIRKQVKCWDIPDIEKEKLLGASYHLRDAYCVMCIAYLNNFTDETMDFGGFFDEYLSIKKQLRKLLNEYFLNSMELFDFLDLDKVLDICNKAEEEQVVSVKRKYLIELLEQLRKRRQLF